MELRLRYSLVPGLLLSLCDPVEQMLDCTGNDSFRESQCPDFQACSHCERFSGARLTVGQDRRVVTLETPASSVTL